MRGQKQFGQHKHKDNQSRTTTSEVPTWNLIQKLAKKKNINIKIVRFDDYVQPNLALSDGEIDINAFQTVVYFDDFIKQRNLKLSAIGTTNIWPMGIYSKRYKKISEVKDGDQVVIRKTRRTSEGLCFCCKKPA